MGGVGGKAGAGWGRGFQRKGAKRGEVGNQRKGAKGQRRKGGEGEEHGGVWSTKDRKGGKGAKGDRVGRRVFG